jgi:hypothetical protein
MKRIIAIVTIVAMLGCSTTLRVDPTTGQSTKVTEPRWPTATEAAAMASIATVMSGIVLELIKFTREWLAEKDVAKAEAAQVKAKELQKYLDKVTALYLQMQDGKATNGDWKLLQEQDPRNLWTSKPLPASS